MKPGAQKKGKRWKRFTELASRCSDHVSAHRIVFLLCTFIFLVLAGAGITICHIFAQAEEEQIRDQALTLAVDTGKWFSDQLDLAILPLFSLAQFATELEMFDNLPERVAPLPFAGPQANGKIKRNITGVCDDPVLWKRFTKIASALKRSAQMEGILVNLQLAPEGVICLLHPLNNTEDFEEGIYMDNTGGWGMDLLFEPTSKYLSEEAIKSGTLTVAGPLPLGQCLDCHATVETAFIVILPIASEDHVVFVDGEPYKRWGFANALINWSELVERSGIYENFAETNMGFRLTRTDHTFDPETNEYTQEVRRIEAGLATLKNYCVLTVLLFACSGGALG